MEDNDLKLDFSAKVRLVKYLVCSRFGELFFLKLHCFTLKCFPACSCPLTKFQSDKTWFIFHFAVILCWFMSIENILLLLLPCINFLIDGKCLKIMYKKSLSLLHCVINRHCQSWCIVSAAIYQGMHLLRAL